MAVIDGKWLSKEGLTYFWSKIKAIFTKQTETNVIANLGAKNLLDYTFTINGDPNARTNNGVTFTLNADGTISLSGTATANITAAWIQQKYVVPDDPVILSGCPSGGASNKYRIDILNGNQTGSVVAADYGNGVEIKSSMFTNGIGLIRIRIQNGQVCDNLIFKPMIRRAEITDPTFQPYAPTNRELYETRFASKTILPNNVDLNNIKTGGIYNGVTSTGNTAVHMPVANGSFYFVLTVIEANESIIQIFKQLNSAGDPNLYIRRFFIYNSDWDSWYQFTGTQV